MLSPFQSFSGFPDYRFFTGFAKEKYEVEEDHLVENEEMG
jgi:hypothetical protein